MYLSIIFFYDTFLFPPAAIIIIVLRCNKPHFIPCGMVYGVRWPATFFHTQEKYVIFYLDFVCASTSTDKNNLPACTHHKYRPPPTKPTQYVLFDLASSFNRWRRLDCFAFLCFFSSRPKKNNNTLHFSYFSCHFHNISFFPSSSLIHHIIIL